MSIRTTLVSALSLSICCATWAPVEAADEVPLVVASVSMNAKTDKVANLMAMRQYMERAAEAGAHLVVFPEVVLQHCPAWGPVSHVPTEQELGYTSDTAEPIPGESTDKLTEWAQELGVFVVFGMAELGNDGQLHNASVLLGPAGILGSYRKHKLWDSATGGNEHLIFAAGPQPGAVIESPIGRIGLIICVEMFHNLGSAVATEGADILVTVSAWQAQTGSYYESSSTRNARDNGLWHVVSNQAGDLGQYVAYGHSRIIDPEGEIVADTGAEEGLAVATTGVLVDATSLPPRLTSVGGSTWGAVKQWVAPYETPLSGPTAP